MNQDWEKWGKDIRNIVQDAIDSQDFNKLNQTITNTVSDAVSGIQKGLSHAGQAVNQAADETKKQMGRNIKNIHRTAGTADLFKKNIYQKAGGTALSVCGYILTIGIGIAILILFLIGVLIGTFFMGIKIAIGILIPLFAASAVMAWKGTVMLSSFKRFQKYIGTLHGRTYCNIKDLAEATGKSLKYVQKDVRMMIQKGWFKEGHFDDENTCLIVSHDTYKEYQILQRQRMEQIQSQAAKKSEKKEEINSNLNSEAQRIMEEGNKYIRRIKECNDAIPGEKISKKISHMEILVQRIFERVKQDPDSLEDIHKLMEYYLPTTVKLLEAYSELDNQPIQGENILSSKQEIEQTLDTLNVAFEKLLDSLFQDVAWDVSSDISVLHTMLAQEGLTENDFEREGTKR